MSPPTPLEDRDGLLRLRRGHAPNCSSGSSVVGVALVSAAAAGVVVNAWADRFLRWRDRPPGDPTPTPTPRLRAESFGAVLAWLGVQLHLSPAWAASALAAGAIPVGDGALVEGALTAPTEAHLSLTSRCPASCSGCYLSAGPEGPEPDLSELEDALEQLAGMGVLEVAFGGGEALLRPEVLRLARRARALGMTPNLTTSGFGLTDALAAELAGLMGQVNVSIDGLGAVYRAARGWDGAERGLAALRRLAAAGARAGVNTVLSRPLLETPGALDALADAVAAAGAAEWQWLRFKPVGRGRESWEALAPSSAQLQALWPRALAVEARTGLTLRYDCAMAPFLAAEGLPPERLARLGVSGCVGGESLWARDDRGGWAPCSFAAAAAGDAPLRTRWREDAALLAWRSRAAAPPEPCASCAHRSICRGGCRAVSAFLTGDAMAPDPQCPRVIAWSA